MAKDSKVKKGEKGRKKENGTHVSLLTKILFMSLMPLIVMAVLLTVVGVRSIRAGMRQEVIYRLQGLTTSLGGTLEILNQGDFSLDESENLMKGNYNLTSHVEVLDSMVEGTNNEITIFYDKTRRATTLMKPGTDERMLGTDASEEVYQQVVKNGEDYTSYSVPINGENYYAYYTPLKNQAGQVVGMYFAGSPSAEIDSFIMEKVMSLVFCAVVVGIIALVFVTISAIAIRKGLSMTNAAVLGLVEGNLNMQIDGLVLRRNDELGDMARGVQSLQTELLQILSKVKESAEMLLNAGGELGSMATQASGTADDISHAVEDISRGAVSQSEEIEVASARIGEMGDVIERIVDSVGSLDTTSGNMKVAGDQSVSIIKDLSHSNDKTMEAIERIGKQVYETNESANKISEAIEIITSIAEETNLLSLNASIEAARAGEQGKGFAVVANQISKLAEQSNESAQKIAEIIRQLLVDSENTVVVMNEVQEIVDEQQSKLKETQSQFKDVSRGIDSSREETRGIKGQTTICDSARGKVVDVISNLSAISEENAASTQQTTASMQELNATIALLAEAANRLTGISQDLEENIQFFRF